MKNCPDGAHCNNEALIEELTQALAALLWQHDHNNGTLCGMALQDARAVLAKVRPEPTDPQDAIIMCPRCGKPMTWYEIDSGWDVYECRNENCNWDRSRIPREHWPHYVNVYEVGQSYGGPEEGGWWYDTGSPVTSVKCETYTEAKRLADELREKYPQTGRSSSVLGGDDYRVCIESGYARPYPDHRPHYE